jgi:hypothetical protein
MEAARCFLPSGKEHPHVIVCGLPDDPALKRSLDHLAQIGIRWRAFVEPDLDDQLTAVATEPVPKPLKRFFRKYRLLGSPS